MPIPSSEIASNDAKRATEKAVASFLDLDSTHIQNRARACAWEIEDPKKIVICGAAGSFKSSFAEGLCEELEIPVFDLDEYIVGGWTPNKKAYDQAFATGVNDLLDDLPLQREWIVEHIEACNPVVLELLRPKWAVLMSPGLDEIYNVAKLRSAVDGGSAEVRRQRALSTSKTSSAQFKAAPGKVVAQGNGWFLKKLS